jgi:kojibiose phosphorylase
MAVRTRLADYKGNGTGSTELPDHPVSTEIRLGETCRLDRVVAISTSRDTGEPLEAACRQAGRAMQDVGRVVAAHRDAWLARWAASEFRIEGDPAAQRALRFAVYHLSSAANPEDDRASIGARGLSGTAYKGACVLGH